MRHGKAVLIIQARMGSTRLPGKSMMPLAGKPLIEQIILRVKRAKSVDPIVLATTEKPQDDVLCEVARRNATQVFRGAESDLVDRYYKAALQFGADFIVRLPGDNPVVEPAEIDRIVHRYLESADDFSANTHNILNNDYPDGLGAEVFSTLSLKEIWGTVSDPRNREHPHTNYYEHPEKYKIGTVRCPEEFRRPDLRLDVNTLEDYEFLAELYSDLFPVNPDFHITDIISWYDSVYKHSRKEK